MVGVQREPAPVLALEALPDFFVSLGDHERLLSKQIINLGTEHRYQGPMNSDL